MAGSKKNSKVFLILIIAIIIGVSGFLLFSNNYFSINGFQLTDPSQGQQPQAGGGNTPTAPQPPGEQPVLTVTGNELVNEKLEFDGQYVIEYEFKYPARMGYELNFQKKIDFFITNSYNQGGGAQRDVMQVSGKFDVNNGEPGKWSFSFVPKEGKLDGTFRLIELVKFE